MQRFSGPLREVVVELTHNARASDRSRKKKSNFGGFLGTNSRKIGRFRGNFARVFGGKLYQKAIGCFTDMYLIRFLPISQDFPDLPEFRGSVTTRNIRSPEKGLIQEKVLTYCVSTFWKTIFYMQFEVLCMLCSSVVLKQRTKRPHHASSGHSQEVKNNRNYKNNRLKSGDNRLSEVVVCERFLLSCDWENQFGVF